MATDDGAAADDEREARLQAAHLPSMLELVCEMLGQSEAELVEDNARLKRDIVIYRDLATVALDQLATATRQLNQMGARVLALVAENRELRHKLSTSEAARRAAEQELQG